MKNNYPIHEIGPKIREIRKKQGLKLHDLAKATAMSNALLSKIENGRVIPTLTKLLDITSVLAFTPEDFFKEIDSEIPFSGFELIDKSAYEPYVKEESARGFDYKSIIDRSIKEQSFQVSHVTLEPNNKRPKVQTDAYEYLYILKGEIEYHIGDKVVLISEGNSFFFDGMIPHVPLNKTKTKVEYLVTYFFTERMEKQ